VLSWAGIGDSECVCTELVDDSVLLLEERFFLLLICLVSIMTIIEREMWYGQDSCTCREGAVVLQNVWLR
jgi:hypothetical protein